EHARTPARVDRVATAREARQPDAGYRAHRRAGHAAGALPGEPAIATTVPAPQRVDRLERLWVERPGVLGWLTTTDHKRVGLLYFWTTLAFFGAGGIGAPVRGAERDTTK